MGKHWKGSAILLNTLKNSFASFGFLCMVLVEEATHFSDSTHMNLAGGEVSAGEKSNWVEVASPGKAVGVDSGGASGGNTGEAGVTTSVFMLIVSAVIGIVIGDNVWLHALKILGARRVIRKQRPASNCLFFILDEQSCCF